MKKFLSFTLAACILVSAACGLTACGGNDGSANNGYTFETAYAQAAELGYSGTLEEFIELISGKDGADGKDGVGIKSVTLVNGELIVYGTDEKILFKEKLPLCKHVYGGFSTGLAPTCTSAGYNYRVCSVCGEKDYEGVSQTGHGWDSGTVIFEPDCVHNGLKYYTCTTCGETKSQKIEPTGKHSLKDGACIICNQSAVKILDEYYNGNYGYEYFRALSDGEKFCSLYNAIGEQVISFHTDAEADAQPASGGKYELTAINYAGFGLTREEAVSVWKTYVDDNPLYYWLSKTLAVSNNSIILGVEPEYADGAVRTEYNEQLYNLIDGYKTVAEDESAYSVALAYHDMIIGDIDYAYKSPNVPEDAAWAHNITGVFEKKGAVCEGYARAFQLLLNTRGIENVFVTGESRNQSHAWNLVKLNDNNWYWYDLTWDDTADRYWGVSHDYACATDEEFLESHTPATDQSYGINFLYDLPARSAENYGGDEIKVNDTFTSNRMEYVVVGYDKVNLSKITTGGNAVIPEKVTYRGREFSVVSLMNYENGEPSIQSVISPNHKFKSVHVPSTVLYINDKALNGLGISDLEVITVDENNPYFRAVDGVLFTKNLYTLITYPAGNTRTQYSIPDETYYIANGAFSNSRWRLKLSVLHIGKNVQAAGVANWGNGYPDNSPAKNVISGGWNTIMRMMSDNPSFTVDSENKYYKIKDGMLINVSETVLYTALLDAETIVVPETVVSSDGGAFMGCKNLKSLKLPSFMYTMPDFQGCNALEEVILPENMPVINPFMFGGCSSLKNIDIPESVTWIGQLAFYNCSSLKSVTIPKNVKTIYSRPFAGCTSIEEIKVAEGNTNFTVKNNCLIEIATKTLIQGFANSVIPDDGSVTAIGKYAFGDIYNLTEMDIPEGITSIGDGAFSGCTSLEVLVIPKSVTYIGKEVCAYDKDVFYKGTETEWNAIEIEKGTLTNSPNYRGKIYFYSETKPTTYGNYWHYSNGEITLW